jgi:hypothetical protein
MFSNVFTVQYLLDQQISTISSASKVLKFHSLETLTPLGVGGVVGCVR